MPSSESVAKIRPPSTVNNKVSKHAWGRGVVLAALLVVVPALLGAFAGVDEDDLVSNGWASPRVWLASVLPLLGYLALQVLLFHTLARRFAFDMIAQRSATVSIRETARNNLTNQGLISALVLTIAFAMVQEDPPFPDGAHRMLCQWYAALLNMSIMWLVIAILIASLCLLYVEPLDDDACFQLMSDNVMYFGEPLALTLCACFNCIVALALWTFGTYGGPAGVVCLLAAFCVVLRVYVVFSALSSWTNNALTDEERQARRKWQEDARAQWSKRSSGSGTALALEPRAGQPPAPAALDAPSAL